MKNIKYCAPESSMEIQSEEFLNERRSNLGLINITNPQTVNFKFLGYENNKESIKKLANYCCGYCGDRIANTTVSVDHFRPKGKLSYRNNEFILKDNNFESTNTSKLKSRYGYFLWGSHYKNLIPSCEACNTGRGNQGIYIKRNLTYKIPYGKWSNFPILDTKMSSNTRNNSLYIHSLKYEYPLIFNPYKDNPCEIFSYKIPKVGQNRVVIIRPNKKCSKKKRLKAEISINLLGLNRQNLCFQRGQILEVINQLTRELIRDINSSNKNIESFASFAAVISTQNSLSDASLLGFTRIQSKKVVKILHRKIKIFFPVESSAYLSDTESFYEKIEELRSFSVEFKEDYEKLNDELDSLL